MTECDKVQNDAICCTEPEYKLSKIDEEYIKAIIAYPSATDTEIGNEIGRSRNQVLRIKNRKSVKEYLDKYNQNAIQILIDAREGAARKIKTLTKSDNDRIALDASKEILKSINPETYSGKFDIKTQTTNMTDEEALEYVRELTKK